MNWVGNILERAALILAVLFFLQGPQFITLYTERLGGHVREAKYQVEQAEVAALRADLTLDGLIEKFQGSQDAAIMAQGDYLQKLQVRSRMLEQNLHELMQSSKISRPFIFLKSFYKEIAQDVLQTFQPGLPLTLEGAMWGVFGALFGAFFFFCMKLFVKFTFGKIAFRLKA
jgi:hypothetical protein